MSSVRLGDGRWCGMDWLASGRYSGEIAPDGLAFVQDLLNTVSVGKSVDLFGSLDDAQNWLDDALTRWARVTNHAVQRVELAERDLRQLRDLRDELQLFVRREPGAEIRQLTNSATVLQVDPDGVVQIEPRGTGWRRVAAVLLIEILEAQRADRWRRLKLCKNRRCSAAYYDRSRNNSGVWHDVQVCGNAANLRAYRARQRAQSVPT